MASYKSPAAAQQPSGFRNARHMNTKMVQNARLIWLDSNINQNVITRLQSVINTIDIFTESEECHEFLKEMRNEQVCMIISGSFGRDFVPRVHRMSQLDSIFILCKNKPYHEQWSRDWPKVKGVYTDVQPICDGLKQAAKDCEQNAISFSLVATEHDISKRNLNQLDPMFMYTQIVKEILLVIHFERRHLLDFTGYCRELFEKNGNRQELGNLKMLERGYHKQSPIWWYTLDSFLYSMLNRALRLFDIDVIIKMGFFIGDLHRHIDELHKRQFTGFHAHKQFIVYRGQGMSLVEFEQVYKTKGGLISFNSFLSTCRSEAVSIGYIQRALRNRDLMGVLFEMRIDPKQSTTPFASVAQVGVYEDREHEILFAMHTVFRIREIEQMDRHAKLFRVRLELTSDNDRDLQVLTNRIREDTYPKSEGWKRLSLVLLKLGKPKQAEEVCRILLAQEIFKSKEGYLYDLLGSCKNEQGEYEEAIQLYKKSIEIHEKYSPNDPNLSSSYNNVGNVYNNIGEYGKAQWYYEKHLEIIRKVLPSNHLTLAASYGNIGLVYYKTGDYAKAFSYFNKTLAIHQSLPSNHPLLALTYSNLGEMYFHISQTTTALSYHEKALAIRLKSLPPDHPCLAETYNNFGLVYEKTGDISQARSFFEKAVSIAYKSLPRNHPDSKKWKKNLDRVKM